MHAKYTILKKYLKYLHKYFNYPSTQQYNKKFEVKLVLSNLYLSILVYLDLSLPFSAQVLIISPFIKIVANMYKIHTHNTHTQSTKSAPEDLPGAGLVMCRRLYHVSQVKVWAPKFHLDLQRHGQLAFGSPVYTRHPLML